jgi:hypothetical protein
VLLLVVDQDQKGAFVIVERIGAHRFSRPFSRTREPYRTLRGSARRFDRGNRARTTRYVRLEHLINCGGYSRGLGNLSSCAQTVTIPYRVGKDRYQIVDMETICVVYSSRPLALRGAWLE